MTNEEIIKGLQAVNEHIGKHFNEGGAWMTEFIDNAIKAIEQTRWIPVTESLPARDVNVLAFVKSISFTYQRVMWIDDYYGDWVNFLGAGDEVVAW